MRSAAAMRIVDRRRRPAEAGSRARARRALSQARGRGRPQRRAAAASTSSRSRRAAPATRSAACWKNRSRIANVIPERAVDRACSTSAARASSSASFAGRLQGWRDAGPAGGGLHHRRRRRAGAEPARQADLRARLRRRHLAASARAHHAAGAALPRRHDPGRASLSSRRDAADGCRSAGRFGRLVGYRGRHAGLSLNPAPIWLPIAAVDPCSHRTALMRPGAVPPRDCACAADARDGRVGSMSPRRRLGRAAAQTPRPAPPRRRPPRRRQPRRLAAARARNSRRCAPSSSRRSDNEAKLKREIESIGDDRRKLNQQLIDTAARVRAVEERDRRRPRSG